METAYFRITKAYSEIVSGCNPMLQDSEPLFVVKRSDDRLVVYVHYMDVLSTSLGIRQIQQQLVEEYYGLSK